MKKGTGDGKMEELFRESMERVKQREAPVRDELEKKKRKLEEIIRQQREVHSQFRQYLMGKAETQKLLNRLSIEKIQVLDDIKALRR